MYDNIVDSCSFLLNNFPEAKDCKEYIDQRLSKSSQDNFKFGYFPDIKNIASLISLTGIEILNKYKLFYSNNIEDASGPRTIQYSYFENYPLIIPYKDQYGKIVAIVGRTLLSDLERTKLKLSKYKNTVFKKRYYLFGLYENKKQIIEQNSVYIVEGQIDVIKAMEVGLKNIVALGNSHMTLEQFAVITRYTNNIFLLLDNDDGGLSGRQSIVNKFGKYANIRNFYLPEAYKDIDDYISKEKIESYQDLTFNLK